MEVREDVHLRAPMAAVNPKRGQLENVRRQNECREVGGNVPTCKG